MTKMDYFTIRELNERFLEFMLQGKPATVNQEDYGLFLLHYRDGKTYRDIAKSTGMSYDRARSTISQANRDGADAFLDRICPCCNGTGRKSESP